MTQPHVSVLDWAFRAFMENYDNEEFRHCRIGKIKVGTKEINPNMFQQPKEKIWS